MKKQAPVNEKVFREPTALIQFSRFEVDWRLEFALILESTVFW